MPGSRGSHRKGRRPWLERHLSDPYVQQAQRDGYRSRAAYKLLEIDRRDRLLRRGQRVVDLGAAPGGWSQVARALVGRAGQVIAMDLLPLDPLPGVDCLQGDFRNADDYARLQQLLGGAPVDLVLSDMAPNLSGMQVVDQPRMSDLVELATEFADLVLRPGGSLLVKAFHGEDFDRILKRLRADFTKVAVRKPAASRPESREVYVVAKEHRTG